MRTAFIGRSLPLARNRANQAHRLHPSSAFHLIAIGVYLPNEFRLRRYRYFSCLALKFCGLAIRRSVSPIIRTAFRTRDQGSIGTADAAINDLGRGPSPRK